MTDKQIIIDGVDVSGCEYYFDEKCRCMDFCLNQDFYKCPQCKDNPNCYYKQFKRSEAQCEGMFVTHTDLEMKYKAKEQECEELKDLADYNGMVCNERLDKIDELEHDINELNEQLDQAIAQREAFWAMYRTKHGDLADKYDQLKVENEKLKTTLKFRDSEIDAKDEEILKKCKNNRELIDKIWKLTKTLTEIKKVLQFYSNSTIGVDKGNGIFEFEVCNDNVLGGKLVCSYNTNPAKEALQKISEVLE